MAISYDIKVIKNSKGEGKEQKFVKIYQSNPLTTDEICKKIEQSTSLTSSDILATLLALRNVAKTELAKGNRFYIPGFGWLKISAKLRKKALTKARKLTGKDVVFKQISFQAEKTFKREVAAKTNFVRKKKIASTDYEQDELWQKITEYLQENSVITCNILQTKFNLSRYFAMKWLEKFVSSNKLEVISLKRNKFYKLKE